MITDDGKKWHHLAVKKLSALLRGLTSNNHGDFHCLNCLHTYRTKEKLEKHKNVCNNQDYCYVKMPNKDEKILKYKTGEKSLKVPFVIYADLECLLEKIDSCQNDPEKPFTEKKAEYTPSVYSWITCCSFNESKNEWGYYRGKDRIEIFCKDLTNQAMKIINYEKKEMIPLIDEETKSYEKQKFCFICEKELSTDKNDKNVFTLYHKVRDHCNYTGKFRGAAHNICNLKYKVPKKIPVVFHNSSAYDYHFIIKQLAIEFKGEFECLKET